MKRVYTVVCLFSVGLLVGFAPKEAADSSTKPKENHMDIQKQQDSTTMTAGAMGHQVGEAAQAVKEYSGEKMHEAIRSAQAGLDKSKEEVAQLKKKMSDLSEKTRQKYHQMMENLNHKIQNAEAQLHDLRHASGGAWEAAKDNLKNTMDNLKKASEEAGQVFKKAMSDKSKSPPQQQK